MVINRKKWIIKIALGFIFGGLVVWGIHVIDKQIYWIYSGMLRNYYQFIILFTFSFIIGIVDGLVEKSLIRAFFVGSITGIGGIIIWYFVHGSGKSIVGWFVGSAIAMTLGCSIVFWNGIGVNLFRLHKAQISKEEFYFNMGRRVIIGSVVALIVTRFTDIPFTVLSCGLSSVRELFSGACIGLITYIFDIYYKPLNFKINKDFVRSQNKS